MKSTLIFSFLSLLSTTLYSDWIDPPAPILEKKPYSKIAQEEIPHFMKRHAKNRTPRQNYELALLNIQIENYEEARLFLQEALKLDPHFSYALVQLGYLDLWEGLYEEASLSFLQELEEEKCDPKAYEGLQLVVKKWAHEKRRQAQSLEILYKLHDCNPKDPDPLLSLGNLFIQMENWTEAEILLKKCLLLFPDYKDANFSLAQIYLIQKKGDLAKLIYEKYPNDPEALKGLARVEGQQHSEEHYKYALSKEYAQPLPPVLEKKPYSKIEPEEIPHFMERDDKNRTPQQNYELALLNIQKENYGEARLLLQEVLKLDPHFSYALVQLGYLDLREGLYEEASLAFLQELEEEKCDPKAYEGLQLVVKKWAHEKKRQTQSLEILYKLHDCNPKDPDPLLSLGNLFIQMENWTEAEILLKKCLLLFPDYKDANFSLAQIYLIQKKGDLAKIIYEKYPSDPEALKGIARVEDQQHSEEHYKYALSKEYAQPLPPILEKKPYSKTEKEAPPHFMERPAKNRTAQQSYELALLNIQEENYGEARRLLQETLKLDPHFSYALVQLGYLDLREGLYEEASLAFLQELEEEKCDPKAYEGLQLVVKKWAHEKKRQTQSLEILYKLHDCNPKDPDPLLSLGNLFIQMENWTEAEILLKKCLLLSPDYKDANFSLARIYLLQKKWDLAKIIYEKYPSDPEALKGLARVEGRQGHFSRSEEHYKHVLSQDTKDKESRKEYAQTLTSSWKFKEAQDQYALFLTEDPTDDAAWNESLLVKAHTNPALLFDISYTAAKENDPTLKVPVVKDFYLYSDMHSLLPVSDRLQIDIKGFFYQQKEVNIYNPGVNYEADLAGGQLTSRLLFKDNWRLELYGRAFHAWPVGSMNYPFKETTRFEPGASVIFDSSTHLAYADVHVESVIIKNFAITQSEVLGILGTEFHYLFRPDCMLHPQIEASVRGVNLFDGNFENLETLWLECGMPFLEKTIMGTYEFQHSHFNELTPNYFSYHKQFCNFLGAKLHIPFRANASLDLIYQHNWQLSKKLIQPIGSFIFIANSQLLTGNKITALLTYRLKDRLRISAEGHYFRNTLPYRDWNIKSSLLWQF